MDAGTPTPKPEEQTMSEIITSIAYGDAEALESVTETAMNTLDQSGLDERTYQMVRVAALVATGAPAESYSVSLTDTSEGLEVQDLEGILIALTPVVGAAKVAASASAMLESFFDEDEQVTEVEQLVAVAVADTQDEGEHDEVSELEAV
jgi:4-carboxymuconolactone decarboxylase